MSINDDMLAWRGSILTKKAKGNSELPRVLGGKSHSLGQEQRWEQGKKVMTWT